MGGVSSFVTLEIKSKSVGEKLNLWMRIVLLLSINSRGTDIKPKI